MSDYLKARLPRGLVDRTPAELKATEKMIATIRHTYELYGFEPVETPLFEYTDALGKFLPDQDRPNEGVFSFQDDDEQWLSLRYDLTAPLARFYAENHEKLPKPYRSYRNGWVFRNEKPGPGRFRQFMQFDADTVGAPSVSADAELCMMMADTMDELGLKGDFVVRVNNRKVLDGVLESVGIGGAENAATRLTVLRALDKLDKIGAAGVRDLLGPGRWENPDEKSGDFTKGANLETWQIDKLERLYAREAGMSQDFFRFMPSNELLDDDLLINDSKTDVGANVVGNISFLDVFEEVFGDSPTFVQGANELREISALVRSAGYGTKRIRTDISIVRGLEYYTGPVFEAELTFEVTGDDGKPVRFGSVGGGGRYDGLVGRFLKEPVPATGFSIGVSRLMAALKMRGKVGTDKVSGPVCVLVMDRTPEAMAGYQKMVAELREAKIPAEMYLGSSGPKAQMKYADRRNAPCVVIEGSNERDAGVVQIKDLVRGKELAANVADHAEYKAARLGQKPVSRADLVAEVRAIVEAASK